MARTTTALWNNEWIQEYESVWGILEKFKLANSINGHELLSIIGDSETRKKISLQTVSVNSTEIVKMSHLSPSRLGKYFGVDLHNYNEKLVYSAIHVFPDKTEIASIFYPALSYCPICIREGYHSIFHQIKLFEYCAFHPTEKLKLTCPNCDEIFREYSVGKKEEAFFCHECKRPIINNLSFQNIKPFWKNHKVIMSKLVKNWLDIPLESVNKYQYFYPTQYLKANELAAGMSNHYADFPRLFHRLFSQKEGIINKTNYSSFKLQSKYNVLRYHNLEDEYRWNYTYQNIFDQFRRKTNKNNATIREINLSLHYECFIQSKAILKSAERYILNKRIPAHMKCVKNFFNEKDESSKCVYAKAFVEWKSECYGYGLETWRIEKPQGLREHKFYYEDWFESFQIYPRLNWLNQFEFILRHFSRKRGDYQYKLILHVINTLLFKILVNRFEQYVDMFEKRVPHLHFRILHDNVSLFILAIPNDEKENLIILI